jgi:hypothetical protein
MSENGYQALSNRSIKTSLEMKNSRFVGKKKGVGILLSLSGKAAIVSK